MRLAVPIWQGRVSPLLDVARRLVVVDVIGGEAAFTKLYPLGGPNRERIVSELGIDVLICGAVSRELEEKLVASGVEVVAEIRGKFEEVVRAHAEGRLIQPRFLMPGHHARWRRARKQQFSLESVDASDRRSAERAGNAIGGWSGEDGSEDWMVH